MASTIQVRVEDELKSKSDALFKDLGTDTTTAIRIFLTQAVATNGFPFEIKRQPESNPYAPMTEAEMLAKKAGESGMCEADYLRLLISQKPNDYPEVRELLKELINEVNRIGININQIVFNNNAGLYSKEDKTQLVAYMRKLNKKVNEAVVQIGNQ